MTPRRPAIQPTSSPGASRERWFGVELRHLAALAAVAEEGSFRGAAQRLGYVQSAVSQQVAFLEQLVGVRLLERSRGIAPVTTTEAGRILLWHAEGILGLLYAARADLAVLGDGTVGVGVDAAVGRRLLPGILAVLAREHPGLRVVPVEAGSDAQRAELVERGELDVAFVDLPIAGGPLETAELLRDPMVLLVGARSPRTAPDHAIGRDELADLRLIAAPGRRPRNGRAREMPSSTIQALVGAGGGAAIVPRLAVDHDDDATTVIELDGSFMPRVLGLCWHRDRLLGDAVRAFRDAALGCCAEPVESSTEARR